MIETLDYAQPAPPNRAKTIARFAFTSLFFPLLVAGLLYGQWLLAWAVLGHPPRPSLDDPKYIHGSSWMHNITGIALVSALPAAVVAFALNVVHVMVNRRSWKRTALRLVVIVVSWVALFALFRWDPGRVVYWWFD